MSRIILNISKITTFKNGNILKRSRFVTNKNENITKNSKIEIDINENYAKEFLNDLLNESIIKNASDIHIEPYNESLTIRIRVDGELLKINNMDIKMYSSIATFIKLKSGMNIAERRIPQDGSFDMNIINGESLDIRSSTLPTIYGEKIVLRLLNRNEIFKDRKELGFLEEDINKIDNIIKDSTGILLVTGATGSGKTTTVYSILKELINKSKNIMTIEDPVEYRIEGINQIQVNEKVGLTFDNGLKAILRQDPDIIIVGEIRDVETAKTAIRAAITGHLVISTMHTNDAITSVMRLMEMGIEPYLISSSLIGVISQKLVKKECDKCDEDKLTIDSNNTVNFESEEECPYCKGARYKGRTVLYEILEINDEIKRAINYNCDYTKIRKVAKDNNLIVSNKEFIEKNRLNTKQGSKQV